MSDTLAAHDVCQVIDAIGDAILFLTRTPAGERSAEHCDRIADLRLARNTLLIAAIRPVKVTPC